MPKVVQNILSHAQRSDMQNIIWQHQLKHETWRNENWTKMLSEDKETTTWLAELKYKIIK